MANLHKIRWSCEHYRIAMISIEFGVDLLKYVWYNVDILIRRKVIMRESDQELLLIIVVCCVIVVSVFWNYTPIC